MKSSASELGLRQPSEKDKNIAIWNIIDYCSQPFNVPGALAFFDHLFAM